MREDACMSEPAGRDRLVTVTAEGDVAQPPQQVFSIVGDPLTYSSWCGGVLDVEAAPAAEHEPPAWFIRVGARVGLIKMSTRLRMELVIDEPPTHLAFQRRELNQPGHSRASLRVDVRATATGSTVVTTIELGASKLPPGAEALLRREVRKSSKRIESLLSQPLR